jgi:hypothetical protein
MSDSNTDSVQNGREAPASYALGHACSPRNRPMAWNAQSALRRKALRWLSTERALCVTCRHLERAVAQRLEQRLPNPCVVGSSPSRLAKASHQGRFPQIFLSSVKSVPGPGLLAKSARYWIVGPARGRLQLVGGSRPGSSWSVLLNVPALTAVATESFLVPAPATSAVRPTCHQQQ